MNNTVEDIKRAIFIAKEVLTEQIEEILAKSQKMAGNTHEFAEKNALPPKEVKIPSLDLDINLNLNIRTRIFEIEFVK